MRGVTMDITAAVQAEIERADLLQRESQARQDAAPRYAGWQAASSGLRRRATLPVFPPRT